MPEEGFVAPQERVNIVYRSHVGDTEEEVELPLKLLMLGDFTLRPDDTLFEDRAPISVDKGNFDEVMCKQDLELNISVRNRLKEGPDSELGLRLKFERLEDFEPASMARQVPELSGLLELRAALLSLKSPLSRIPAFRGKIQEILGDEARRLRLSQELGLGR